MKDAKKVTTAIDNETDDLDLATDDADLHR
mgnify:CR=1 FL=1